MEKVTTGRPPSLPSDVTSPKLSRTDAMSASFTARPALSGISVCDSSNAFWALPSTRTDWRDPAISALPPAALTLTCRSTWLTCEAVTPKDCILAGSSVTSISRLTPPMRDTSAMPSTDSRRLATVSSMNHDNCSSVMSSAETEK